MNIKNIAREIGLSKEELDLVEASATGQMAEISQAKIVSELILANRLKTAAEKNIQSQQNLADSNGVFATRLNRLTMALVIVGILQVIVAAFLAYANLDAQRTNAPRGSLENSYTCQKAALDYNSVFHRDEDDGTYTLPNYGYNKELGSCFYSISYISSGGTVISDIINLMTGENVYSYTVVEGEPFIGNPEEFEQRKKEYLGY